VKRRNQTHITVWPAITDLMLTIVIISIIGGVLGYSKFNSLQRKNVEFIDSMDEQQETISDLRQSIRSLKVSEKILLELPETRKHILDKLESRLEESGMSAEVRHEEGVLRLSDDAINFPLGGETPISRHQDNIGWLAGTLAELVPCYTSSNNRNMKQENNGSRSNRPSYCQPHVSNPKCEGQDLPWLLGTILIEGHTDTVAVGSDRRFKNNLELSSVRAASVYEMIVACEPIIKEMRNTRGVPVFSTSGYGEMRLAIPSDPGNDYNRRIDLRFLFEPKRDEN